jgi:hypothetical protein
MRFTKKFVAGLFYQASSGNWEWVDIKQVSYQSDDCQDARDFFVQRFKDPANKRYSGHLYMKRGSWWYWVEWWTATKDGGALLNWKATGKDYDTLRPLDLSDTATMKRYVFRSIGIKTVEIVVSARDYESALEQVKAITKSKYILQLARVE